MDLNWSLCNVEICWTSLDSRTSLRDCITLRWQTCIQPLKHVTKHSVNPLSRFPNQLVPHFWVHMQYFVCAACILVHHFAAFRITYHILFPMEDQQRNRDLFSTAFNLFHNPQKLQSSRCPGFTSVPEEGMNKKQNEYYSYYITMQNIPQRTGGNQMNVAGVSKGPTSQSRLKVLL